MILEKNIKLHESVPPIAAEKLIAVMEMALQEPRKLYMDTWKANSEEEFIELNIEDRLPPCGTVACIAGWVVELEQNSKALRNGRSFFIVATEILQITHEQSRSLFYPAYWPLRLLRDLRQATTGTELYAEIVCCRIIYFLENGK
jgi:hypothetical protein